MDLAAELQKIYDSEINVEITISWFWDSIHGVGLSNHWSASAASRLTKHSASFALA
jgi:hypothetical protein